MNDMSDGLVGLGRSLSTPKDLLVKLRWDFGRIEKAHGDVYAAFDFFVTAEHLPEWVGTKDVRRTEPLLRIVSHLATGAKHFVPSAVRHRSVANVEIREGSFDSECFDPNAFDTGGLTVVLQGNESEVFGDEISVVELARQVLDFWEQRIPA